MKNNFKNNWDVIITYFFTLLTIILSLWGFGTCMNLGCVFALILNIISLLFTITFLIILFMRNKKIKSNLRKILTFPVLVVIVSVILYIILNV